MVLLDIGVKVWPLRLGRDTQHVPSGLTLLDLEIAKGRAKQCQYWLADFGY